ncbi:tetratricopeptide repeat protein [Thalassobaculum sp. OXR-137]|uniref:O-linked N-acetylglucosamine transferase family protein n=1 Tax=Thalassobaculum sp. OXR-137 TaxID=3100173 RepID=UPI002AC9A692|nr:tetratricopeptide repeat protein [Thalassobaculum sp. OXR-137]WPZ34683.1 tetratricopeptide repeat protein [Thalassobaculum sp. OXR-137]
MADLRIDALFNTALRAHRQGDMATATRLYGQLLAIDPAHAPAQFLSGMALLTARQPERALPHVAEAVRLAPDTASYRQGLAEIHLTLGRAEEAERAFRMTALCDPASTASWTWLGGRRELAGDLTGAERCARFARCLAETPASAMAHAAILSRLGDVEAAWPLADRSVRLTGTYNPLADLKSGLMFPPVPMSREQIEQSRRRFADSLERVAESGLRLDDPTLQIGRTPFYLAYHGLDDRPLAERFNAVLHAATPAFQEDRPETPRSGGRLRVGVFSTFFNAHTVLRYTRGLMRAMARRDGLDVIALPTTAIPEPGRAHLESLGCSVVPVVRDYPQAVRQIRALNLDVLVFADIGMEPLSGALACTGLAPRQIALSGHPDTTGTRRLDGYVVCPRFEPAGYEQHYSEPTIPAAFWPLDYSASVSDPASIERPDRDWSRPTLICAQAVFKIHPDMDACFREILERIPTALLYFIGLPAGRRPITERFVARLRAGGIDVEGRVRFLPFMSTRAYLGWIHHADAVLDSWHFSGGDSTFAALSAVAPVVTLEGGFYRGRQTAGLLREIGAAETVATSAEGYSAIVERMVADRDYAAHLRADIAAKAPLAFDRMDGADALIDAILGL